MKVLIVKISSLGDVISTLPAVTDATRALPDISFDWVVEENFAEIPSLHPAIEKVIPISLRRLKKNPLNLKAIRDMVSFWQNLRAKNYDLIIDPQGLIKSALVAKIAHGKICGFDKNSARESLASYFYHYKFAISKNMHAVERIRQLFAKSLNYPNDNNNLSYGIDKTRIKSTITYNQDYLVFAHGSSRDNKCWDINRWIELARLANKLNLKVKLPWGNQQELSRAKKIASSSDNAEVLPKASLTELAAILSSAKWVIAVDTGLGHLAAALEVPSISLYGPTNPNLAGAYGKLQSSLINMSNLTADEVFEKLVKKFPNYS